MTATTSNTEKVTAVLLCSVKTSSTNLSCCVIVTEPISAVQPLASFDLSSRPPPPSPVLLLYPS